MDPRKCQPVFCKGLAFLFANILYYCISHKPTNVCNAMNPSCLINTYVTYFFPACVNTLIFQTDIVSKEVTFRFTHKALGYCDITKATGADGKFTFTLADLPKQYIFNPWFGPFALSVLYENQQYEFFYIAYGKQIKVSIEAQNSIFTQSSFIFDKFILQLSGEVITPPDEEGIGFWQIGTTFVVAESDPSLFGINNFVIS